MIRSWRALIAVTALSLCPVAALAQPEKLRIATFNVELTRDGPGLLLRDLRQGDDPQITAVVEVIVTTQPDILAVQGIDYDFGLETLTAFQAKLTEAGAAMPYVLALPTNRGLQTGLDLDGDGRTGRASDAQGFGHYYGQGAMALLSRFPIDADAVRDFTDQRWIDLPNANLPTHPDGSAFPDADTLAAQRLSSSGHWVVPVQLPGGVRLSVMTFHASPPVFDGPEDRNGRRNADEIRFWQSLMAGDLGEAPQAPFVIAGAATLDPEDSEGRREAIADLLSDPRLIDPKPRSRGGAVAADQGHRGDNALDTVDWDGVGRLRVDYVLPSADLKVLDSGVFWPEHGAEGHEAALSASRHRLVWVDLAPPGYTRD